MHQVKVIGIENIIAPRSGDVGFDLLCPEDFELGYRDSVVIDTGVHIEMPDDLYARIEEKSSLAQLGIHVHAGIIDPSYRGSIKVIMSNALQVGYAFQKYQKIAQLVFCPYVIPELVPVEELQATIRGENGFGSTGL